MSATTPPEGITVEDGQEEPVPALQKILDSPFLLLFLGVTIPTVFYLIWGMIEVISIPIGK